MSSWTSQHQTPKFRFGYRQIVPEGTFIEKKMPATVVSAYYEMSSKYKLQEYRAWIRLFLESTPCYLVFFTEDALVPFIQDCRRHFTDRTHIVTLPREEWNANKKYSQAEWDALVSLDPERQFGHTSELYKIWYEKNDFVLLAISLNPFCHTDFVWTDAGICRDPKLAALVKEFPVANRIPTDRMMLLNVLPFTPKDELVKNGFVGGGEDKPRIGGGILAGSINVWSEYHTLYTSTVERFRKAGIFWGKDQTVMKTIVMEHKSKVSLIDAKPILSNYWLYSLLYLGASQRVFAILTSEKTNQQRRDYDYFLAL